MQLGIILNRYAELSFFTCNYSVTVRKQLFTSQSLFFLPEAVCRCIYRCSFVCMSLVGSFHKILHLRRLQFVLCLFIIKVLYVNNVFLFFFSETTREVRVCFANLFYRFFSYNLLASMHFVVTFSVDNCAYI